MNAESIATPAKRMPAVIYGLTRTEYDLINRISWSKLKIMGKSPAHYRHALLQPEGERTDALIVGNATHVSVFEPEDFASRFAVWREGRRAGKEWEAFKKKNAGRDILTEAQALEVHAIAKAVRDDATASKYVSGGRAEVSLTWTQTLPEFAGMPETVVESKARLDFIGADFISDLKTARDASPSRFGSQAWNLDYLGQASWYVDGYKAVTGRELPFFMVVVEKTPPFVTQVYEVTAPLLEMGRERYRDLLGRWAFCKSEGRWPGYVDGLSELQLPKWAGGFDDEEDLTGMDLVIAEEQ